MNWSLCVQYLTIILSSILKTNKSSNNKKSIPSSFSLKKEIKGLQSEHLLSTTFNSFRCNSKNCFRCSVVVEFLAFCISIRVGRVVRSFVASTTEMSACSSCLSDDALCEIFKNLDVPDLLSCTKVCRKWKCVIESLVLGRSFFQRLKKSSAAWRRAWRKLAQDETNLKAEDYKNICWLQAYLQYLEKVEDNWRTGSYKLKTSSHTKTGFAVGEDFITAYYSETVRVETVRILDRESLELKREFRPNHPEYQIIDVNTVAYVESKGLTFHDINTGQLISRFELNESPSRFDACCPTAKLWTVRADFENVFRLTLWTVDNAANVTLIKTIEVPRFDHLKFQVDEQFILNQTSPDHRHQTCHLISTGIVHDTALERSLSVRSQLWPRYDRGLLFLRNRNQLIRILDVASGTYLHDINMGKCRWIEDIKANSNYVVIIADSNLYVYSLQALRNPLPGDALVFKIKYCHDLYSLTVDETQIVFQDGIQGLTQFFDFGSFDEKPMSTLAAP